MLQNLLSINQASEKKNSMILRLEMILSFIFYEKHLNLRKIILLMMFFLVEFFLTIVSYQFFKNDWILINYGLFIFKQNVFVQKLLVTILATKNFTFKIRNCRVVESIFSEKKSHDS